MSTALANSLLVAASVGFLVFVLLVQVPALARSQYRARLSELRDDLMDEVLADRLPGDDPVVEYHLTRFEVLMADSPRMSMSFAVAAKIAATRGRTPRIYQPNMQHLLPAQRETLKASERKLTVAVYRVLTRGSLLWLPIALGRFWARHTRHTNIPGQPSIWRIAGDYVRVGRSTQASRLLLH